MDLNPLAATASRPVLPSIPAGAGVGDGGFQDMLAGELARQKAAATVNGRVPSAQEAQITAAQIAAQANVLGPLKRDPIIPGAGMNTQPVAPVQPVPGKFFPLHHTPVVPQGQTVPSRAVAPTTVEKLRATSKYGPGPVTTNGNAAQRFTVPQAPATETATASSQVTSPWFNQAMQNLDKYDAMKSQSAEK